MDAEVVLSVRDLRVEFPSVLGVVHAINGLTFDVRRNRVLGLIGESGCGKSVASRTIMRILEPPGRVTGGSILLARGGSEPAARASPSPTDRADVVDLLDLDPRGPEIRAIRGGTVALIPDEPSRALNPIYTVGEQIDEAIEKHQPCANAEVRQATVRILNQTGLADPQRIADSYPHELSAGMRRRALIAMALSCEPSLLIADEPTADLDVTTQAQVLNLLFRSQQELGLAMIYITNNLPLAGQVCDDIAVLYLGTVVEYGAVAEVFHAPKHPYTVSLLHAIPGLHSRRDTRLSVIGGEPPDPYAEVPGCPYHPRCPELIDETCAKLEPSETHLNERVSHKVRCHLYTAGQDNDGLAHVTEDSSQREWEEVAGP